MTKELNLAVPSVHINGTSKQALLEDLTHAGHAIVQAISALQMVAPHGRDYYPQGSDALRVATSEHLARIQKLQDILSEIAYIADKVAG